MEIDIRTILAFCIILIYNVFIIVLIFHIHKQRKEVKQKDTAIYWDPLLDKWVEGENKDC